MDISSAGPWEGEMASECMCVPPVIQRLHGGKGGMGQGWTAGSAPAGWVRWLEDEGMHGFNWPLVQAAPTMQTLLPGFPGAGWPSSGPLSKSALNRSRRAWSPGSVPFLFMCPAAPASLAFLFQRDFALLAVSKRYFMLKFNTEMLTSHWNQAVKVRVA
jgi:hypothetical protein